VSVFHVVINVPFQQKQMKTYKIKLDEFDAHMMKAMKFNIQTIEDACLAGIAQQIRDQDEDEKKVEKTH